MIRIVQTVKSIVFTAINQFMMVNIANGCHASIGVKVIAIFHATMTVMVQ